jgi:hypothetical protein
MHALLKLPVACILDDAVMIWHPPGVLAHPGAAQQLSHRDLVRPYLCTSCEPIRFASRNNILAPGQCTQQQCLPARLAYLLLLLFTS